MEGAFILWRVDNCNIYSGPIVGNIILKKTIREIEELLRLLILHKGYVMAYGCWIVAKMRRITGHNNVDDLYASHSPS